MNCAACGGTIGIECFNPEECMEITREQAASYRHMNEHEPTPREQIQIAAGDAYVKAVENPCGEKTYTTLIRIGTDIWEIRVTLESERYRAIKNAEQSP